MKFHFSTFLLLSHEDSNLDKQNQNLLCYHYTIGQSSVAFFWKSCAKISPFGGKYKFFPILLPRERKRESETVDRCNYFLNLVVGEQRVQGKAQFFGRKLLGNGKREIVPLYIAPLLVGRHRIVYLCLNSERG